MITGKYPESNINFRGGDGMTYQTITGGGRKKMYRKSLIIILMTVCFLFGLISVGGAQEKLVVWIGGHVVEQEETWAKIVEDFEKQSGVDVEYRLIGFEVYYDSLVTAYEAGEPPDVCFADLGGWVPTFASQGWLEPLDDWLASWEGVDQIWENLWPTVTYEGKKYGLPWYTDCRLLLYNKIMFKEAGLDPDDPPQSWDELLEYAKLLTDASQMKYGYGVSGAMSETTTLGYMIFLFGAGGELLTSDYRQAAFNTSEGLEALKFYTDLYTKHQVSPPGTPGYTEDDYRTMMAQNRIAMAIGGPWSFPLIELANPEIKGNYMVATHPYLREPASVLGGWASVISATSQNKEIAWEFIKYITSYDVWVYWIEQHGGPMPTRIDVCSDVPQFQDPKWKVILDTFPYAKVRPPIPEWPEVSHAIQSMVQRVLTGEMTSEEAIEWADNEVNAILGK